MNFKKNKGKFISLPMTLLVAICAVDSIKRLKNDAAKWMLIPVKIIMRGTGTWPENQTIPEKVLTFIIMFSFVLLVMGILIYCRNNSHDWTAIIFTILAVTGSLQVFAKYATLISYNWRLKKMLLAVRNDFWPSFLANKDIQIRMKKDNKLVKIIIAGLIGSTFLLIANLTLNFVVGRHALPIQFDFWFKTSQSPVFELFYLGQLFSVWFVAFLINGFDLLFFIFIKMYVAQMRILASVLSGMKQPSKKIRKYFLLLEGVLDDDFIRHQIFIKCIKHHNVLIEMFESIKSVYSLLIIVQFLSSLISITFSCVTLTIVPDETVKMATYVIIMLIPLFLYCWIGSQLQSEGMLLADAAYKSNWEQFTNNELKKEILLIMEMSQQEMILSGANLINLNLENFLKIMKLSFSIYTLTQSLVNKTK